jgi:hypothetical protein
MKCEKVQEMLSRYLTDEVAASVKTAMAEHLSDCANCREALAFHRSLTAEMSASTSAPTGLYGRVHERVAAPRPGLLTRLFGDPTMKKILISSTVATALLAAALIMTPRSASANNPVEKFNKMRAAVTKAMKNGELELNVSSDKAGVVLVVGTLDGAPLPAGFPMKVDTSRDGNVLDIDVTIDLDPNNYSAIRYGKNENTLVLVPKGDSKRKSELVLDPKTMKPKSWTTAKSDGLLDKVVGDPPPVDPEVEQNLPRKIDSRIHARIKMYVGGNAQIKVNG